MNKQRLQLEIALPEKLYDLISSGEKKEIYQEIKPHWTKKLLRTKDSEPVKFDSILLKCRYKSDKPKLEIAFVNTEIRKGKEKWGAEPGKIYYVICLGSTIAIDGDPVLKKQVVQPSTFWNDFKNEHPEQYNVSKLENSLENFAYYLAPFLGPKSEPHNKKVKRFLKEYQESIAAAEKIIVFTAFWVFFNGMTSFAVKEVFRKGSI